MIIDDSKAGTPLGKQDFPFSTGEWKDGVFSVNSSNVTGLATMLSGCYDSNAATLQLRLGDRFSTLSFTVGQGNSGESMHDRVLVKVEANGRPITPKSVTFTNPTSFEIPVKGVNGVEISFSLDSDVQNCGSNGAVQAVLYNVIVKK